MGQTGKTQTEIYRERILSMLSPTQTAGYLREELEALLGYLHYYKLKNILKNMDLLLEYMTFLDNQNSKQFQKIITEYNSPETTEHQNIHYFVSEDSVELLGEQNLQNILNNKPAQHIIQNIILSIKGLLLLTANEFCHATSTRISLNRLERERLENKKNKKNEREIAKK